MDPTIAIAIISAPVFALGGYAAWLIFRRRNPHLTADERHDLLSAFAGPIGDTVPRPKRTRNPYCSSCGDTRGGGYGHETSECTWNRPNRG